jgi:hypothetical protein
MYSVKQSHFPKQKAVWCGDGIFKVLYLFHVPSLFPSVSNDVLRFSRRFLRKFLKFSMCSPTVFPIAPHFNPYPFPKVLLFLPTWLTQREVNLTSHTSSTAKDWLLCLGESHVSSFFLCETPIKMAHCRGKKLQNN